MSGGDLNGDGFAELFIGVRQGGNGYGAVVFGSSSPTDLDTGALTASEGFNLTGYEYADSLGRGVSFAGDVNGDGYGDMLISAPWADGPSNGANQSGDT